MPRMKLFSIIVVTVIYSLTAAAQVDIIDSPQRSRVLNTKGLETAPSQLLWKSEKLFTYRETEWVDAQIGSSNPLQNGKTIPPPVNFAEGVMYSLGSDGI